jgi:HrpA-like RNA helicase
LYLRLFSPSVIRLLFIIFANDESTDVWKYFVVKKSLETLYLLGALNRDGSISELGRQMAVFPLDPAYAKVLIMSKEYACTEEVLTIISMLCVENIFVTQTHSSQRLLGAEEIIHNRKMFDHPGGDHLVLLNVYNAYVANQCSSKWCRKHFLNPKALQNVQVSISPYPSSSFLFHPKKD